MKTLLSALSILFFFTLSSVEAQQNSPNVTLKIAEKSGFLGMGGAKFLNITLSNATREKNLNSDNVNSGQYFYFILNNENKWKIDADFLKDDLPRLSLVQENGKFSAKNSDPIITEGDMTSILVGFPKTFALHKPFSFTFPAGDKLSSVEMIVPIEFWQGYSTVTNFFDDAEKAFQSQQYKIAIHYYNSIIANNYFEIFPSYAKAKENRVSAFEQYYQGTNKFFLQSISDPKSDLKQKIAESNVAITKFRYVVDSLPNSSIGIDVTEPKIVVLLQTAQSSLAQSTAALDSLQHTLDDANTTWIIAGSSTAKTDFRYKYIIETLAYASVSIPFADTAQRVDQRSRRESSTKKDLLFTVSDELIGRLKKYNLTESYETFLRIINTRVQSKQSFFPDNFLSNLRRDSAQFPLPFYSVMKSVSDFYGGNYGSAKSEILQVFSKSYEHGLTGRLDELRILIETIQKKIPAEVLKHLHDGRIAEEGGNNDAAVEHYKDAILKSEEYAPASFALGKLYDRIGDTYKANNFFQKSIGSDSLYYSAYRFLYLNFYRKGNFKPMIDLLNGALAHGNNFYNIHYYLGIAYNGAGIFEEAINQYQRALELNGKSIEANIQAGLAYQNMKSYAKAREFYTRAIQIDPENQTATESLKRLDELQKKF